MIHSDARQLAYPRGGLNVVDEREEEEEEEEEETEEEEEEVGEEEDEEERRFGLSFFVAPLQKMSARLQAGGLVRLIPCHYDINVMPLKRCVCSVRRRGRGEPRRGSSPRRIVSPDMACACAVATTTVIVVATIAVTVIVLFARSPLRLYTRLIPLPV